MYVPGSHKPQANVFIRPWIVCTSKCPLTKKVFRVQLKCRADTDFSEKCKAGLGRSSFVVGSGATLLVFVLNWTSGCNYFFKKIGGSEVHLCI